MVFDMIPLSLTMGQVGEFLYYNFFGIVSLILAALTYQAKTRRVILLYNVFCSLSWVLYFLFQGAFVSAAVCFIAFARAVIFCLGVKYQWANHVGWLYFFIAATIIAGFGGYSSPLDIVPIAAGSVICLSMFCKKESNIRLVSFVGFLLWIANGAINGLYFALVSDCISLLSIIVAWIRFYGLKKQKKESVSV